MLYESRYKVSTYLFHPSIGADAPIPIYAFFLSFQFEVNEAASMIDQVDLVAHRHAAVVGSHETSRHTHVQAHELVLMVV